MTVSMKKEKTEMTTLNGRTLAMMALSALPMACGTEGKERASIGQAIAGPKVEAPKAADPAALVERGKRLVTLGACHDCHTPLKMGPNGPERDTARLLSGHPSSLTMPPAPELPPGPWMAVMAATMTAWSGPWGTSFTANLTPDRETGTGTWKTEDFIATARTGRHMGKGRQLLPPMPVEVLVQFTDEELTAIFAYLSSLPPVKNKVPSPIPPKPASAVEPQKEARK
jgi:mono/diheme cytochrome c family protein